MPDASRPVGDLTDDQIRKRLRVPVREAAHLLGISPEAVRSRLYRGTLDKETGTDGTIYVRLHDDQLRHDDEQTADQSQPNTELVGELRERIEDLREQLAEEREAYRVTIATALGVREVDVAVPSVSIAAAERTGAVSVVVRQRGMFGESSAAELNVPA